MTSQVFSLSRTGFFWHFDDIYYANSKAISSFVEYYVGICKIFSVPRKLWPKLFFIMTKEGNFYKSLLISNISGILSEEKNSSFINIFGNQLHITSTKVKKYDVVSYCIHARNLTVCRHIRAASLLYTTTYGHISGEMYT
jgi:hypothetical protein